MEVGDEINGIKMLVKDTGERDSSRSIVARFLCWCGEEFNFNRGLVTRGVRISCGCLRGDKVEIGQKINGIELLIRDTGKLYHNKVVSLFKCHCGNEFESPYAVIINGKKKSCGTFCKNKCDIGDKFNRLTVTKILDEQDPRGGVQVSCVCDCGKLIDKILFSSIKNDKVKSCGCISRNDVIGERFGIMTVMRLLDEKRCGKLMYECKCDCGNLCKVRSNHLNDKYSCGCYLVNVRAALKLRSGSKSNFWNPDLTDEERASNVKRSWDEKENFRKFVFKRDNYTCQTCLERGCKLNAHHVYSYKDYPEYRSNINFGCTLCDKCHKQYHKEYGRRHCTEYSFLMFLSDKNIDYDTIMGKTKVETLNV